MPTYVFECQSCNQYTEEVYRIADMPESVTCECGGSALRTIQAPTVLRASYPDGVKRKGFQDLREANALFKAKRGTKDTGDKKRIEQQIKQMNVDIGDKKA